MTKRNLLILISALILGGLVVAPQVQSNGPQFNYMPQDPELLRVANSTQGTNWGDPTSANPGDVIAFNLYYHNGRENTVAINTQLRVNLPEEAGTQLVANGYLWADNAAIVADTGTININGQAQKISYLPGTTKWYPNRSLEPVSLPDGITESGVNIGDITGCWPYGGRVVFQAQLEDVITPEPEFVFSKTSWNLSRDVDATSIINRPNELIEYRLTAKNTGDGQGSIQVKDNIGGVLKYAVITNLYGGNLANNVISWPAVNLDPGQSVTKRFRVRIKEAIPANQLVHLINEYGNRVDVPARREISFNPGLSTQKVVRNLSQNETKFVKQNTGQPGDLLQYRIKVINQGDVQLNNLRVKDILPAKVGYINNTAFYGYGPTAINQPLSNQIVTNGVNLGQLIHQGQAEGQYQWLRIQFKVRVNSGLGVGSYNLKNRVTTNASYQTEISSGQLSDSSWAQTSIIVRGQPALTINKEVRNLTRPTDWMKRVEAYVNERVSYRITIKNTGQTVISDLQAIDILPANVYFLPGSARLTYRGSTSQLSNSLVSQYINLPNLNQNEQLVITFKARIDANLAKGAILINTGQTRGAGLNERSTAKIVIIEKQPEPSVEGIYKGPLAKSGSSLSWFFALMGLISVGYWCYALKLLK